jgi:hypothetical protein
MGPSALSSTDMVLSAKTIMARAPRYRRADVERGVGEFLGAAATSRPSRSKTRGVLIGSVRGASSHSFPLHRRL